MNRKQRDKNRRTNHFLLAGANNREGRVCARCNLPLKWGELHYSKGRYSCGDTPAAREYDAFAAMVRVEFGISYVNAPQAMFTYLRTSLSNALRQEADRRACMLYGEPNRYVRDELLRAFEEEGGYCLDAPDEIPAGSCCREDYSELLGEEFDLVMVVLSKVKREDLR